MHICPIVKLIISGGGSGQRFSIIEVAKEKGFTNLKMEVCKEKGPRKGVRIISGYTPDGQYFENLIVVALTSQPTGIIKYLTKSKRKLLERANVREVLFLTRCLKFRLGIYILSF